MANLVGSLQAERARLGSILRATRAHAAGVARRPWGHRAVALGLLAGLFAIGLDAYTTIAMMNSGLFEEANGAAEAGMALIGRDTYVALASLLCVGFTGLVLAKGPGLLPRALVLAAWAFIGLKLYTGVSNAVLWHSVVG